MEDEGIMQLKEAYLDRVVGEVEDLATRVAHLKSQFAKQKVSIKLDHYWELEYVRTRFAEFKRRVQELEDADDQEVQQIQEAVEVAWKDLIHAVETLLAALS
jgi:Fe-S-cluster formation regulator IscX/YfhJ